MRALYALIGILALSACTHVGDHPGMGYGTSQWCRHLFGLSVLPGKTIDEGVPIIEQTADALSLDAASFRGEGKLQQAEALDVTSSGLRDAAVSIRSRGYTVSIDVFPTDGGIFTDVPPPMVETVRAELAQVPGVQSVEWSPNVFEVRFAIFTTWTELRDLMKLDGVASVGPHMDLDHPFGLSPSEAQLEEARLAALQEASCDRTGVSSMPPLAFP
jgi:hypothetical protein